MPRVSAATSLIGRNVAAFAISMSDSKLVALPLCVARHVPRAHVSRSAAN